MDIHCKACNGQKRAHICSKRGKVDDSKRLRPRASGSAGAGVEGEAWVGRQVEKYFPKFGNFSGEVIGYYSQNELYRVLYEDADWETLSRDALLKILVDAAACTHACPLCKGLYTEAYLERRKALGMKSQHTVANERCAEEHAALDAAEMCSSGDDDVPLSQRQRVRLVRKQQTHEHDKQEQQRQPLAKRVETPDLTCPHCGRNFGCLHPHARKGALANHVKSCSKRDSTQHDSSMTGGRKGASQGESRSETGHAQEAEIGCRSAAVVESEDDDADDLPLRLRPRLLIAKGDGEDIARGVCGGGVGTEGKHEQGQEETDKGASVGASVSAIVGPVPLRRTDSENNQVYRCVPSKTESKQSVTVEGRETGCAREKGSVMRQDTLSKQGGGVTGAAEKGSKRDSNPGGAADERWEMSENGDASGEDCIVIRGLRVTLGTLVQAVEERGGLDRCTNDRKWSEVVSFFSVQIRVRCCGSCCTEPYLKHVTVSEPNHVWPHVQHVNP